MTLTLIIFSQLCLIVAVWGLNKQRIKLRGEILSFWLKQRQEWMLLIRKELNGYEAKAEGLTAQARLEAKLAEKMADRAFNMASSANVGIAILQKALAVPRLMTKAQGVRNEVAKNGIDKLLTTEGNMDWLRPILSDEENDLLDEAEALRNKQIMNGSKG